MRIVNTVYVSAIIFISLMLLLLFKFIQLESSQQTQNPGLVIENICVAIGMSEFLWKIIGHLLGSYCMLGILLCTLHGFFHLSGTTTLWSKTDYYDANFTDDPAETKIGEIIWPKPLEFLQK